MSNRNMRINDEIYYKLADYRKLLTEFEHPLWEKCSNSDLVIKLLNDAMGQYQQLKILKNEEPDV
jgi:hypothetical protein